ncbi:hypothetical protein KK062_18180 [Fulvivirgaceae bacterium PWU5]|uniref:Uncharacterized protein n=1 Tax=Dawidia cretensis TaxID=2782350 RepID=A0AAP2DYX1_9BACT|nr:hypothetical protein [Dawidia cretensis]MBT1710180.1 hypothetical protein [Dawidia cretensis]
MARTSRSLMRVVLMALLLQILAPVFLPIVTLAADIQNDHAVLHAHHSPIVIPQLLKEKEDDETGLSHDLWVTDYITLIDFSDHTRILTQSHESRLMPCSFSERIDLHPPLHTLFGVYII